MRIPPLHFTKRGGCKGGERGVRGRGVRGGVRGVRRVNEGASPALH